MAAAWLTFYNNQVIDAAKTGKLSPFTDYPEVHKRIVEAAGDERRSKLPAFMRSSKNGRRECNENRKYAKLNDSTMNRIYKTFLKKTRINFDLAGIPNFNWIMLCPAELYDIEPDYSIVKIFCNMDDSGANALKNSSNSIDEAKELLCAFDIIRDAILHELEEKYDIQTAYISILKYLFSGENFNKSAHKQMFWRCFGDIAVEVLRRNLENCNTCPHCGERYPIWQTEHVCRFNKSEFGTCVDCGNLFKKTGTKQVRCPECQENYRKAYIRKKTKSYYYANKEASQCSMS